jgi:hypothetical protein
MSYARALFDTAGLPVLFDQHGQAMVYATPSGECPMTMVPASPATRLDGDTVVPIGVDLCDFLVEAVELEQNGIDSPASGHEIAWHRGAHREKYLVVPPSPDLRCFEREDAAGLVLRIHAKRISKG